MIVYSNFGSRCVESMVLSATAIIIVLVSIECFVVYFWVWFGIVWVNCVCHRGGTLQVSPKRVYLV